ncbi:hypothetical protein MMB232_01656 [Brevundimonas subvibrioides]|uniref:RNA-binding protein n=1 Tax=Brevundimonas subvibrioides TaxID=74313 RepID=UPI0032D5A189
MSEVEAFLDDTPGEVRGIVVRDGLYERLIVQRESDSPAHRLGAVSIGRIARVEGAFRAAFVDLGCAGPMGFLPLSKGQSLAEGTAVEVEVAAEPREAKGPTLRLRGMGQGAPRLLSDGPSVLEELARFAPDSVPVTGSDAIRASLEVEEEAMTIAHLFPRFALDLAIQRTRALIAVDLDYAHLPGRDARKGRDGANREGLVQAARLLRLKGWGGLVAIDLVGTALDPKVVSEMTRSAFGPAATVGPISRFGLLQLTLPWRTRPIDDLLMEANGTRSRMTRAIDLTRRLRLALASDTASPRLTVRCAPQDAEIAAPLVTRLGPRAAVVADAHIAPGHPVFEQG